MADPKILADLINLKGIAEEVLRDYNLSEQQRLEAADKIYERYKNTVKIITTKFLEIEAEKRSTLSTFNELMGLRTKGNQEK